MTPLKSLVFLAAASTLAAPAFAETLPNPEKSRLYEADYAAVLADNNFAVGTAIYGQYDADYDVYLTDAALFQPVLGHHDADYEAQLDRDAFTQMQIASR